MKLRDRLSLVGFWLWNRYAIARPKIYLLDGRLYRQKELTFGQFKRTIGVFRQLNAGTPGTLDSNETFLAAILDGNVVDELLAILLVPVFGSSRPFKAENVSNSDLLRVVSDFFLLNRKWLAALKSTDDLSNLFRKMADLAR